jgi:hypothetical protein
MIEADLQGKLHVPEDVLTSNCFGLMRLLPDSYLAEFLGLATSISGEFIPLSGFTEILSFKFWPWLPTGGIPDAIAMMVSPEHMNTVAVIIEIKHGSGKSGFSEGPFENAEIDRTQENPEQQESHKTVGDQLARYWLAAERFFRDCSDPPILIYLTHHCSYLKEDVEESLKRAGTRCRIVWLNWFQLYGWVARKLEKSPYIPLAESRILQKLQGYLKAKGYASFLGWNNLPIAQAVLPLFRRTYDVTMDFSPNPVLNVFLMSQYSRTYQRNPQNCETIKSFYKRRCNEQ